MVKVFTFLALICIGNLLNAQSGCIPAETFFKLNFGSPSAPEGDYIMKAGGYSKVNDKCPNDGMYAIVPQTYSCFDNSWHKIYVDHTGKGGNFLLVNAAENIKRLIIFPVKNLLAGKDYEFSFWVNNVLDSPKGCSPNQPVIELKIESDDGEVLKNFSTGSIAQTSSSNWVQFKVYFSLPESRNGIFIRMENRVPGGCGNDFALDDFELKICKPEEEKTIPTKTEVVAPNLVKKETELKKAISEEEARLKLLKAEQEKLLEEKEATTAEVEKQKAALEKINAELLAAKALLEASKIDEVKQEEVKKLQEEKKEITNLVFKRENPVLETLKLKEGPFTISVYDDKLVDGDSISLLINGEIALMKVPLTKEALVVNYTIDKNNPRIELVFIAENLGLIPPNTGTLEIKSGNKTQQVFVKTNEEKNAKIIIELY